MKNNFRYFGVIAFTTLIMSPLSADDWPFSVAQSGCSFEWIGPNGYREKAVSLGKGAFPVIRFARDDMGPQVMKFTPLCGEPCETVQGQQALRDLFPIKVGNTASFSAYGAIISMDVEAVETTEYLGDIDTYRVRMRETGRRDILSWWSPKIGWITRFQSGNFAKVVTSISCPDISLPKAGS